VAAALVQIRASSQAVAFVYIGPGQAVFRHYSTCLNNSVVWELA
jgi:hypothetical protein